MGLTGATAVLQCAHARLENGAFGEGVNPSSARVRFAISSLVGAGRSPQHALE